MTMSQVTNVTPVEVLIPARSWKNDLRGIKVVWQRELIRFSRDRMRIVTSLIQPILYLFVLGTGLSTITGSLGQFNMRTFLFPGVITLAVLFTAIFSAGSIVWDREFGFLREMLVAPVRRSAIVIGKVCGGATVAALQGFILLVFCGLVGIPYNIALITFVALELILIALMITAFGVMMAARIKTFQAFMALTQLVMLPMFFLSGALFPLANLPTWLQILTHINPLTYAVDLVRRTVFSFIDVPPGAEIFTHGVMWGDWRVPIWAEVLVIIGLGLIMLQVAIAAFKRL